MRRYSIAGHLLRNARHEAHITLRELAEVSGVSASRLSEYENGKRDPGVDTLLRILAATDHTVKLVDAVDSDFPNLYLTGKILPALLDVSNAITGQVTESGVR